MADTRAMGAHALLVDDDRTIRLLLSRVLADAGIKVTAAENAGQAAAIAEQDRSITALVTDVRLPDRSGAALAREIQALYPGLRVVAISGDPGSLAELDSSWIVLTKPFAMSELVDAILDTTTLDYVVR